MRTKIISFSFGIVYSMCCIGQIPTIDQGQSYKTLVGTLERKFIPDSMNLYFLPSWSKDTVMAIRDEITLAQTKKLWKDSFDLERETPVLYQQILALPSLSIPLPAKYGNKNPEKRRSYYEEKRLVVINASFDSAFVHKNKRQMTQAIDLMMFYLMHQSVLSKDQYKDYKEVFVKIRTSYANYLFELHTKGQCEDKDFNKLFDVFTLIESCRDLNQASGILRCRYASIEKYIRYNNASLGNAIKFDDFVTYYLSLLKLYGLGYSSQNPRQRTDYLIACFRSMTSLRYSQERELVIYNIKRYLEEKYDIPL